MGLVAATCMVLFTGEMFGQAVPRDAAAFHGLLWIGVIVGTAVVATLVLLGIRKRFHAAKDVPAGFTLDELRALRDRGELTVPEYEALRRKAADRFRDSGSAQPVE